MSSSRLKDGGLEGEKVERLVSKRGFFFSQFFVAPEREKPESEQHYLAVEGGK